jgi:hypothetical protein
LRAEKGTPTPRNPFLVVTAVYKNEGIRALYKGCGPLVLVSRTLSLVSSDSNSDLIFVPESRLPNSDSLATSHEHSLYTSLRSVPTLVTGLSRQRWSALPVLRSDKGGLF